jgi:hypothetical protein
MPKVKKTAPVITVECGGELVDMGLLKPFQGDLKTLHKSEYQKLRTSIIEFGVTFPFMVWKDADANHWIIDGHQRLFTLKRMKAEEGATIPALVPVVFVNAADFKQAREKVLLASSAYGKMDEESLYKYLAESDIAWDDVVGVIDLPQIDSKEFEAGYIDPEGGIPKDFGAEIPKLVKLTIQIPAEDYQAFTDELASLKDRFPNILFKQK